MWAHFGVALFLCSAPFAHALARVKQVRGLHENPSLESKNFEIALPEFSKWKYIGGGTQGTAYKIDGMDMVVKRSTVSSGLRNNSRLAENEIRVLERLQGCKAVAQLQDWQKSALFASVDILLDFAPGIQADQFLQMEEHATNPALCARVFASMIRAYTWLFIRPRGTG